MHPLLKVVVWVLDGYTYFILFPISYFLETPAPVSGMEPFWMCTSAGGRTFWDSGVAVCLPAVKCVSPSSKLWGTRTIPSKEDWWC